jgi:hypothetical protein
MIIFDYLHQMIKRILSSDEDNQQNCNGVCSAFRNIQIRVGQYLSWPYNMQQFVHHRKGFGDGSCIDLDTTSVKHGLAIDHFGLNVGHLLQLLQRFDPVHVTRLTILLFSFDDQVDVLRCRERMRSQSDFVQSLDTRIGGVHQTRNVPLASLQFSLQLIDQFLIAQLLPLRIFVFFANFIRRPVHFPLDPLVLELLVKVLLPTAFPGTHATEAEINFKS